MTADRSREEEPPKYCLLYILTAFQEVLTSPISKKEINEVQYTEMEGSDRHLHPKKKLCTVGKLLTLSGFLEVFEEESFRLSIF
ncbi:hypothetical protein WA026_005613 [Henosepilachna vigintioctopunctata]|uniref:Uncharacterized protein n=1 Tax=Henosepilachna vigintioctopunctata TaxID=420089 RepID=A0AAW1U3S1_9CUCU